MGQGAPITIGVELPPLKLLGRAGLDRSACDLAASVSTQQMRDVTCLRTNCIEIARPSASLYGRGLDRQRINIQTDRRNVCPTTIVIGEQTDGTHRYL